MAGIPYNLYSFGVLLMAVYYNVSQVKTQEGLCKLTKTSDIKL